MKMSRPLFWIIIAACFACSKDDYTSIPSEMDQLLIEVLESRADGAGLDYFILPNNTDFNIIPQDPLNPLTAEKVALGKLLLHETATGGDPKMGINKHTYACASCHPVASGFFSGLRQGIGEGGMGFGVKGEGRVMMPVEIMPRDSVDILPIKVPTLINVAYQEVALWNGALGGAGINAPFVAQNAEEFPDNLLGFQGLEVQGMLGQDVHRLQIDADFVNTFGYKELFDAAFPDIPESERYSRLTGGLALAAFNRTVLANKAPWQEWLKGNFSALTSSQKEGALLFFEKGKCYQCHTGPALKSTAFFAWGMGDIGSVVGNNNGFSGNVTKGRGEFTGLEKDEFTFKVPTLYNLKDNLSFGHGGTFNSVYDVIAYKNNGEKQQTVVPDTRLAPQFGNTYLTEEEIGKITDFIENGLYDPELRRYVPEAVLSGNCIPNNDPQSRIDLGCE